MLAQYQTAVDKITCLTMLGNEYFFNYYSIGTPLWT